MKQHSVYVSLGSSMGDRVAMLREAVRHLQSVLMIDKVSQLYISVPLGSNQEDALMSAVAHGYTALRPTDLLRELLFIERSMGRRQGVQFGPSVIDLDILFYDALQLETPGLVIPHPRLTERPAVLKPLAEIAPTLVHPVLYHTTTQLLGYVDDADHVKHYSPTEAPAYSSHP